MTELMTFDDTEDQAVPARLRDRHRARGADGRRLGAQPRRQLQVRRRLGLERDEAVPDRRRHDAGVRQRRRSPGSGPRPSRPQDDKTLDAGVRAALQPRGPHARGRLRGAVPQDDGLRRSARYRTTARSRAPGSTPTTSSSSTRTSSRSQNLALEDGRRDIGEENGMTCSQCHIRNFGMHDYADPGERRSDQGHAEDAEPRDRDARTSRSSRGTRLGGVHARVPPAPGVPRQAACSHEFLGRRRGEGPDLPAREVSRAPRWPAKARSSRSSTPRRAGREDAHRRLGCVHRRRHRAGLGHRRARRAGARAVRDDPDDPRRRRTATASCGRWASRRCRSSG